MAELNDSDQISTGAPTGARRPAVLLAGITAVLVALVVVLGIFIRLPVIAYSPGPLYYPLEMIEVPEEVESFPPEGEMLMLTISGDDSVNIFEAVFYVISSDIDLVPQSVVRRPGESDEEYRERGRRSMDQSVEVAVAVALDRLGYEMDETRVVVTGVLDGVPADQVLDPGDELIAVDGNPVNVRDDVLSVIDEKEAGDVIVLTLTRSGSEREVEVELVEMDGETRVGIEVEEMVDPPIDIEIDTQSVAGPSAGMMYALAVYDHLTPGDLTGGSVVAGTGTLDAEGNIGGIGGIRQKVIAAQEAGAEYILLATGNLQEAESVALEDRVALVPVSTIDEAIEFLESLGD